jgi:hypothetical protein
MDENLGGTAEAPVNGPASSGAAENTGAGNQSGTGEAAPHNGESRIDNAGDPQGNAEGGQSDNGARDERRNRLMVDRDELLGLRGDRRTLRTKVAELEARLEELRTGGPQPQPKPAPNKTEQDFWADPNARFMSLEDKLANLEERVAERVSKSFQEVRTRDTQTAQLNQERSEAVKLVHSQPNWDKADDTVLVDIIEEYGLGALPPLRGAEAALALFYKQKGVGDKSAVRARAASLVGAPGAAGVAKTWPKDEVERLLDIELKKSPDKMNKSLIQEIKTAQAENRIR